MELHGITFGGGFHTGGVGDRQHTVFVSVGACVLNAVSFELEHIGAIRTEHHFGAAVIAGNTDGRSGGRCFLCGSLRSSFLCFVRVHPGEDGFRILVQSEDRFGHEVQNLRHIGRIKHAVFVMIAEGQKALHLAGIGIGFNFGCCMSRSVDGIGAVAVLGVAAFRFGGVYQTQAGIVTDNSTLAGFNHIAVREQVIASFPVQSQRDVHIETAFILEQAAHIVTQELVIGQDVCVSVAILLVQRNGIGSTEVGVLPADDGAAIQSPFGFRHEVQHSGFGGRIIYAVGIAAVYIHFCGSLHLGGIGVGLQFKCGVGRNRCGYSTVIVSHIGAFCDGLQYQAQTGIVANYGALSRLDNIAVGLQLIGAVRRQIQRHIHIQAAVRPCEAGQVTAQELIGGHHVRVSVAIGLIVGYLIGSGGSSG